MILELGVYKLQIFGCVAMVVGKELFVYDIEVLLGTTHKRRGITTAGHKYSLLTIVYLFALLDVEYWLDSALLDAGEIDLLVGYLAQFLEPYAALQGRHILRALRDNEEMGLVKA